MGFFSRSKPAGDDDNDKDKGKGKDPKDKGTDPNDKGDAKGKSDSNDGAKDSKDDGEKKEGEAAPKGRQPIPPGIRARLQKSFEHATQNANRGSFDYATDLFVQCVTADPGNLVYVQAFLRNLYKKYNDNKKGSKMAGFSGMTIQGGIKKGMMKKDWPVVLKSGLEMLKLNPWHWNTLSNMAKACQELGYDEVQLAYLKSALDADSKNPEINKQCAEALARQGQFDQAIACWHRVELAKPGNEEAQRAIAALSVERTISRTMSGEEANEMRKLREAEEKEKRLADAAENAKQSPEIRLRKAIADDPANIRNYTDLAEFFGKAEKHEEVEKVLVKALEVAGGDIKIRELLEDARIRRSRHHLTIAEKRTAADASDDNKKLLKKVKAEMNLVELEVFRSRTERYPASINYKVEFAKRLKAAGNFPEAIKIFQAARSDPKRKGEVLLELGECFQMIGQMPLGLKNYQDALEVITEREEDLRKKVLYRAGRLAMELAEYEVAEKHMQELAGRDFAYKDVAACLDKIRKMRNDA